MKIPGVRCIVQSLSALTVLALGACAAERDAPAPTPPDITDADGDADAGDAVDHGDDAAPELAELPQLAEQRQVSLFWEPTFMVAADGVHLLAPMLHDAPDAVTPARAFIGSVDTTTLAVTEGAPIPLGTSHDDVELYPSSDPDLVWMFTYHAPRLTTVAVATGAAGAALALPDHPRISAVRWTQDLTAPSIGYATEDSWEGVYVVHPPLDPGAFSAEETSFDDFAFDPVAFFRFSVVPGGRFLVMSDAPPRPEPDCVICTAHSPDAPLGHFRVFDLDAPEPHAPVISEDGYDASFRVGTSDRWIYRSRDGRVVAIDLEDQTRGTAHELPCASVKGMRFGPDGGFVCLVMDSTHPTTLDRYGPDLALRASVPMTIERELLAWSMVNFDILTPAVDAELHHAVVGHQFVDFDATPPTVRELSFPSFPPNGIVPSALTTNYVSAGPWLWVYDFDVDDHVVRIGWADGSVRVTSIPSQGIRQIESLADGLALSRDGATIEIYGHDLRLRGTVARRTPATP